MTFPSTSRLLAERLRTARVIVNPTQSVIAIAIMGGLVGGACYRGAQTEGESKLFRAVTSGLEAHVLTHVLASVVSRRYTAGLITAPTVMLPSAWRVRAVLHRTGSPLGFSDTARGGALMITAAFASHLVARALVRSVSL